MPKRTAYRGSPLEEPKGATPLFLDKEGRWFHEGVEITHVRTRQLFSRNIRSDSSGKYYIHVGPERAEVIVEDTPYAIRSVTIQEEPDGLPTDYILHLNDETQEPLASGTLVVNDQNVMYCRVKGGSERARFLRAAYYQICGKLEYDPAEDRYWLPYGDDKITIHLDG